jgi:hypothetical protein
MGLKTGEKRRSWIGGDLGVGGEDAGSEVGEGGAALGAAVGRRADGGRR